VKELSKTPARIQNSFEGKTQNRESLESNKNSGKSGLIIKIRSGNDVIMSEEVQIDQEKISKAHLLNSKEEHKAKTTHSSCSASTVSVEGQEEKSRRGSISSIELDNNIKIICKSIGPLKASERRQKVMHYLEKKRSRKWHKRINYK